MVLLLPVPWWMVHLVQASYTHTNAACSNAMPTSLQTPGVQLAYCLCRGGWWIWYRPHTRTQTQHAQTQCLLSANTWCAARLLPVPWWMVDLVQASYTHKRSMLKRNAYLSANAWCAARLLPVPWWMVDLVQASYTHTNAACSNTMPTLCKHLVCSSPTACAVMDGGFGTGLIHTQTQHAQTQCLPLCKRLVCSSPTACAMVDGGFGTGLIHTHTQTQHAQTQCLLSANTWCAARLLPVPWWMVHLGSQPLDWWLAAVHPDGVAAQPARRKVGFLNACKDGRV